MAVTTTNLGVITAYGDAVAAGYTGTKAEWQALMASYATVGQQAVDAKNAAVAAKDTAVSKATEATTAANTATTKASEASASAQSIAQSAAQIAQNTSDISELKEDLSESVSDLKSALTNVVDEINPERKMTWVVGGIATATGEDIGGSNRRRIDDYLKESDYVQIESGGAELYLIRYSFDGSNYTYNSALAVYGTNDPYVFSTDSEYYFRLSCSTPNKVDDVVCVYRSKLIKDVKSLVNVVPQLQTDVAAVQASLTIDKTTDLFNMTNFVKKHISWSDGTETANNDARTSDFIPVSEGDILTYTLTDIGQMTAAIGCYDSSKDYVQSKSVKAAGTAGTWTTSSGTYTIPSGVSYIKFSSYRVNLTTDSITKTTPIGIDDFVENPNPLQWQGKKWAAFGTSITDTSYIDTTFLVQTGKYPPYLAELSGMKFNNFGIAGGSIMTDIQTKVKQTTLTGYDVVTVEGSVNDHATSKPIGNVGDTGTDTFAGAIYQIAKYVYENSNATLFFITDYVGRYVHINPTPAGTDFYGDCAPTKTNNDNLLQIDYINMMIKQCEYFGIPCITAGQDSGINLLTGDLYLIDHIHSTFAGGKQYAETIWSYLKNVRPRVLSA